MKLVLLGAPGCGKGTHSEWLKQDLGIPQISTGDILRDAVAGETELGGKAKEYMDRGQLVPDELILGMMGERLAEPDTARGFILDGFPRTVPQAEGLDRLLAEHDQQLDRVLRIDVPAEELVRRLTSRRVCPSCKAVYNMQFRPPKEEGLCDSCGGEVIQRADDTEETVRSRLGVFENQTAPLIDYYQAKGLLAAVDGGQGFELVRAQAREVLGLT